MIDRFRGDYSFLSNFYLCEIPYTGHKFASVEHAFQWAKCPSSVFHLEDIFNARSAADAKKVGRRCRNILSDWDEKKIDVMRILVKTKFVEHPALMIRLLATASEELVEGNNWGDKFWGVCGGVGENHLGKILMEVRKELER